MHSASEDEPLYLSDLSDVSANDFIETEPRLTFLAMTSAHTYHSTTY